MKIAAGAFAVLVCSAALATEPEQRTLTFENRVDAQKAIERVYYSHQLDATKPFKEAVPKAVLEAKVRKYLEQSVALSAYWKTPVTDQALQRELERMAHGTRMPERLLELYAALGNDPFLIKECLARPALVDRLTHNFYAMDPTLHTKERGRAARIHAQLVSGALSPSIEQPNRTVLELLVGEPVAGAIPDSQPFKQRLTSEEFLKRRAELPSAVGQVSDVEETRDALAFDVVLSETPTDVRVANYVVPKIPWDEWWETARQTVSGASVAAVASGLVVAPAPRNLGSIDPTTPCSDDGWENGVLGDLPSPRVEHVTVWTGSQMIVWGGRYGIGGFLNTGGRYDPATDTWSPTSTVSAPFPRNLATAVWTGSQMIVWGGGYSNLLPSFGNGGRYDPATDRWTPMSTQGAPAGRESHTAVWTGSVMVIWGGRSFDPFRFYDWPRDAGGRYDPATDRWTTVSETGAPARRFNHTAVWTGHEMVVWGGESQGYPSYVNSGGRYDPETDRWTPTASIGAPSGRTGHTEVWTGNRMVVWGGTECEYLSEPPHYCNPRPANIGGRYDPAADTWEATSTVDAPTAVRGQSAVWTGNRVIVWNGYSQGRYDPVSDLWTPVSSVGAPSPRRSFSMVWTGSLMVVWGGQVGSSSSFYGLGNDGGRYDPTTDSWTPTSMTEAPSSRRGHTLVWTGNLMVVWGGDSGPETAELLNTGGKYDPTLDDWTPTATTSAPAGRTGHTAVWTGSLMVVFGAGDAGGRYDPLDDRWTPTSATGAPVPRGGSTAVWTGSSMLIWGGLDDIGLVNSGGRYDPAADLWSPMSTIGAPSARVDHRAVWVQDCMVVWGGYGGTSYLNTGGRYDPAGDTWTPTSTAGAPSARTAFSAVSTRNLMIVWGGYVDGSTRTASGARYDVATDSWTPTSSVGAPPGRTTHAAVSTGSLMVVWGGLVNVYPYGAIDAGGWYDPQTDHWTKISTAGEPAAVPAVWTGDSILAWGGAHGGRYVFGAALDEDCDGDGFSAAAGDCDDHAASVFPGAAEFCDGINNDCNDLTWPSTAAVAEDDFDQDGFRRCQGDCDDTKASVYPGAPQLCDGINNDCDDHSPPSESDNDQDGFRVCQGDCDDSHRTVHPGAQESCDALDNDCDGVVDEGGDALCRPYDPCYDAICAGVEGCRAVPNTSTCDDGNTCTSGDVCADGSCHGTPLNGDPCDDGNECTANDSCSNFSCRGTPTIGNACSDYNLCTTDDYCADGWCHGGSPLECDDSNPCNGLEYCSWYAGCTAGPPPVCDDGNVCTDDSCDPSTGCIATANTAPCDDGNPCTTNDVCGSGQCGGTPLTGSACDDGDTCTINDVCGGDGNCHGGAPVNCDDGNACNGVEICFPNYGCYSNGPPNCNDGNPCTTDGCDPSTGCTYTNNTNSCNDGTACTSDDRCQDGRCAGTPIVCDDHNLCTTDRCSPGTGCVFIDEGNFCDDSNPCTDDACNPATGFCAHVSDDNNSCSDHNLCTQIDTCHGGTCSGSNPIECTAGCPSGFDLVDGLCRVTYFVNASLLDNLDTYCDIAGMNRFNDCNGWDYGFHWADLGGGLAGVTRVDAEFESGLNCGASSSNLSFNGAPAGSFYPVGDCSCETAHGPILVPDLDASAYSIGGINSISIAPNSECEGLSESPSLGNSFARITVTYAPLSTVCRIGVCDPGTGLCGTAAVPDGTSCTDGNLCTSGDACTSGACSGIALDCNDDNPCTDDSCDPATGCIHTNSSDVCSDDNACTSGDRCLDGSCVPSEAINCGDNNACTDDACDPAVGCVFTDNSSSCDDHNPCTDDRCDPSTGCVHTSNAASCNDGNACTSADTCAGGSCNGGAPLACSDSNSCTDDTCNPVTGCDHANNAAACDDGNACTMGDTCGGGSCHGNAPLACNDNNPCTTDSCAPSTGCVFTNNTNACNDGNACTRIDSCSNGSCVGSNPVVCGAADQCHDAGVCNPGTGVCSSTVKPNGSTCDDASLCTTGETCQSGTCTPAFSGLSEPNPRTNGYYKRLCHGPHSGDQLTDADATCVGLIAPTFAGISTVADLCAMLEPSHPNYDPCDRSEDDLIVLALNICRARVCSAQSIDSQCGGNGTVGQSLAESDAILNDASRSAATCAHAKCLDEEINTGRALELDSLTLRREGSGVRLSWNPPYLDDGSAHPSKYNVWRRQQGSLAAFTKIATTTEATFVDALSAGGAFQYEVTAVMN